MDRQPQRGTVDFDGIGRASGAGRFGEFVAQLTYEDLPPEVAHAASLHILDTVGVGIAAAALPGEADSARAAVEVFSAMGGRAEGSVIGAKTLRPAAGAAFANAALCHSLDFDDLHTDSRVHASTVTVPVALAVGERAGSPGRAVVAAVVAGNEVATRVGMGGPRHFQEHGFHATPVCGVFGAVASASALLGLGPQTVANALGIAGDTAGGTNAWIAEGTTNKHLHAGWAAQNGILSALLASRGAKGPGGVFEGRFGVYEALAGAADVDMSAVLATLGELWETPRMAYKAYPSCYWTHGSVQSALELRPALLQSLDDIEAIEAIVPSAAVPIVLEPRATRIHPLTPYAAKFSMQYSIAAMILRGRIDLATYTEQAMREQTVLDLAARVTWVVSPALDAAESVYPGGLRVRLGDGNELKTEVINPVGMELNPMSEAEILSKFEANASLGLDFDDVTALSSDLMGLERLDSLIRPSEILRRVRAQ